MSTLTAHTITLRFGTMTMKVRHKPSAGCTAACKPEVLPISLERDGTWLVHWPHEHPDMRTICEHGGTCLLEIPTDDLPWMESRVGCPDCFDEVGDDVLADWLA